MTIKVSSDPCIPASCALVTGSPGDGEQCVFHHDSSEPQAFPPSDPPDTALENSIVVGVAGREPGESAWWRQGKEPRSCERQLIQENLGQDNSNGVT